MSELTTPVVVSEEAAPTRPESAFLRPGQAVAVAMSLYHVRRDLVRPKRHLRGTHLLFALTLVFLLYPTWPGSRLALAEMLLLALGFGFVLSLDYEYFISRIIYIDDLTWSDKFYAVVAVGIVLRRGACWDSRCRSTGCLPDLHDRLHA